ncbi:MAG: hypothetical protein LBP72_00245 [Dysgonamonadaceae bacterium]|jgi:hypothetical protein|nr:hypothetical protein [Dysgonamonadaceae bacterium]
MTKKILVLFTLLLSANLHAQVSIGDLSAPAKGALLDLNKTVKGGLALSNVKLDNLYTIPATFPGMSSPPPDVNAQFTGAIVYHIGENNIPAGVYVWNGTNWTPAKENCAPLNRLNLTTSTFFVKKNEPITFSVLSNAGKYCAQCEEYDWTVNDVTSKTSVYPESTWTTSFASVGIYEVEVDVSNCYSSPSSKTSSNRVAVFVINDDGSIPSEMVDGNYGISGNLCSDANSLSSATKTYTFTATAAYSDLTVLSPVDDAGIVAGVSQPATTSGSTPAAFTITFASDVKDRVLAAGSPANVKLFLSYKNSSGVFRIASLNIMVRDGICCTGVVIPGGVHVQGNNTDPDAEQKYITDGRGYSQLLNTGDASTSFSKLSPAKDLCVYYRNGSSTLHNVPAINNCYTADPDAIDAADASMGNWRVPNIAELAQMSTDAVSGNVNGAYIQYNQLASVAGASPGTQNITNQFLWSKRDISGGTSLIFQFDTSYSLWINQTFTTQYRCVRSMD